MCGVCVYNMDTISDVCMIQKNKSIHTSELVHALKSGDCEFTGFGQTFDAVGFIVAENKHIVCVAVCCSVLQCVALCCIVLQCVAVCCNMSQCVQ